MDDAERRPGSRFSQGRCQRKRTAQAVEHDAKADESSDDEATTSNDTTSTRTATPKEIAEIFQKIYLGVGKVLTSDEARAVVTSAGFDLSASVPNLQDDRSASPVPARAHEPNRLHTLRQQRALADVYARMSKRLATQARKAAAKPKAFADFLDNFEDRNREQLRAAFDPIVGLCATGSASAGPDTADALLADFRSDLSKLYDTTPADVFTSKVNDAADTFEQSAAKRADLQLTEWLSA